MCFCWSLKPATHTHIYWYKRMKNYAQQRKKTKAKIMLSCGSQAIGSPSSSAHYITAGCTPTQGCNLTGSWHPRCHCDVS